MDSIKCPDCGKEVPPQISTCPACGCSIILKRNEITKRKRSDSDFVVLLSLVALFLFACLGVFYLISTNLHKQAEIKANFNKGVALSGKSDFNSLQSSLKCLAMIPKNSRYYKQAQVISQQVKQKLSAPTIVKYGKEVICDKCGKIVKQFIKTKKVRLDESPNYVIRKVREWALCGSCRLANIKAEAAKREQERKELDNNAILKANAVLAYMEQETQWEMKNHETLFNGNAAWGVRGVYYNGPIPMASITVPFGAKYAIIKDLNTQEERKVNIP